MMPAKTRISSFAQDLVSEWKRLFPPDFEGPAVVAVSGGADSVALTLGLEELLSTGLLSLRLLAAYVDHGLRGKDGEDDALWVRDLASQLGFRSVCERVEVSRVERSDKNLEQAARRARYACLARVAVLENASAVVTGHILDDQAETVILRLVRGSGLDGLSGMPAMRPLDGHSEVLLARPLLAWAKRSDTQAYCQFRGVVPRIDPMNFDRRFARVRVREEVLPLLKEFNPQIVETLGRTAEMMREDAEVLETLARELLKSAALSESGDTSGLSVRVLAQSDKSVRRRALRAWIASERGDLRRLELVHIQTIENLIAGSEEGRIAELPGGAYIERRCQMLRFKQKKE